MNPRYAEVAAVVNNWGRWGDDDERGTLNLLTDESRRRGAETITEGIAVPLGIPLGPTRGVQLGFVKGRSNPTQRLIADDEPLTDDVEWIRTTEDAFDVALQAATHWDALAHVSKGGTIYNGYPATTGRCRIDVVGTIDGRAVLLDLPRAKGISHLEPGHAITPADLDAALDLASTTTQPGDIVLVRTGQMSHLPDLVAYTWPTPGLTIETAPWFHAHGIAAVAIDTLPGEVFPGEHEDCYLPVHLLHLVEMGMTQGQNWVLDDLGEVCAELGRWTFFLEATPLAFEAGLGSPLNPVALL